MLYRPMPKTGDSLSVLGFGCMRLPGGAFGPDETESIRQIRGAIDRGVNYVDTAWPYHGGKSEVILGKALKDGYRPKVKVADKLPYWICKNRDDMDRVLDAQLARLDDERIDYYLIHALDATTWKRTLEMGVVDFLAAAKADGRIVNAGFSFHGPREDFRTILDGADWDFCQIQLNILDEHNQAGVEGLAYAASKDVGVIVMEPLRGGVLAGKQPAKVQRIYDRAAQKRSNAEWALRWVWNLPGVVTVLSGMNNQQHIAENIRIASEARIDSLSEEETAMISEAAETFRSLMKVPCTGCQYCMPCPQNINIPQLFSPYNHRGLYGQRLSTAFQYLFLNGGMNGRDRGLASQCVACGKCVKHCPQGIDIPAELKNVKKEFEGPLTKPLLFLLNRIMSRGPKKG